MGYFTDVGQQAGPFLYRDAIGDIGVQGSRDHPWPPIGMALCTGWGPGGVALWQLTVHGVDVPGRWLVHSREFIPEELGPGAGAHEEGRGPRR
jgi:hypothetical protein